MARANLAVVTGDIALAHRVEEWLELQHGGDGVLDPILHAWLIHHVALSKAFAGEDISVQLAEATRLASRWPCPSLRSLAHVVIDGARLNWPHLCGESAGAHAAHPVDALRTAAQQARSVGAVFVERIVSNTLLAPIVKRAISEDADELHVALCRLHEARLRDLERAYLTNVVPWFATVGLPRSTATILGFLDANGEMVRYDYDDGVAKARLLVADLVDRDEFERQGAAMDLDSLVAYVLHELEQIASSNADGG
ncbi:MAG: hypothetical protein LH616_02145 [Ilumatobacteraceae bacterium]|nr:hypothetical protein [Ilumatobacteraceae bacterium]